MNYPINFDWASLPRGDVIPRSLSPVVLDRPAPVVVPSLVGCAIAAIIEACAPTIRPAGKTHNWHDYARRTATYAFGPKGELTLAKIERHRDQFLRLEGRDPAHEGPRMGV